jgi:hypothetical protein
LEFANQYFKLDPNDYGLKLYKLLKVKNTQEQSVVNILELMAILILLADFGQNNLND